MSVNVFSMEVLFGDTVLTSPHPRSEGLAICKAKVVTSFLSYFKTPSIGPTPGIEPATPRSALKRFTDWANPAQVQIVSVLLKFITLTTTIHQILLFAAGFL